jgi:hypothetical protein
MNAPDYIASVDAGHGETIVSLYTVATGKRKTLSFPSLRSAVTGQTMGIGRDQEHEVTWADWEGRRYSVGYDALLLKRSNLEVHHGKSRYGNELHRFLIARALTMAGVKSGMVALTVFVPPGMYAEISDYVKMSFLHKPEVEIQIKGDRSPRCFSYSSVDIHPEGLIAAAALVMNSDGTFCSTDLTDSTAIVDLGFKTADVALVQGRYNPDDMDFSTHTDAGIGKQLLTPILRDVVPLSSDYAKLTIYDIDMAIRQSIGQKNGRVIVNFAGRADDITDLYEHWLKTYADFIANNIISSDHDDFVGVRYAHFIGGGFALAEKHFRALYGSKIPDIANYPNLKKIKPIDWNVESGMRVALKRARTNGWIE